MKAAEHWKTVALLSDGGIFEPAEDKKLWQINHLEELDKYLIKGLDRNNDKFLEKLGPLLEPRPPRVKQLAAEMWWFILLCSDNLPSQQKRNYIRTVWDGLRILIETGQRFSLNSDSDSR